MRVLVITGDKSFGPGHPRYELQRAAVDELVVLYWGRSAPVPRIPAGTFDVITAQDPFWRGHLAGHIAWLKGARLNIQVHTDLSAYSRLKYWWAGFNLAHADSIRVVSEKIKKQVEHMGVGAKITVLPVFVAVDLFKKITRRPDSGLVLWIGRFEDEKDPLYALEIIRHVPGARLVMLGAGSLEAVLRKRAQGLPVEFAGWQSPVQCLARAAVVLSTSRHESFGVSIIEALAAGVPVVASDVGIAREAGAIVVPKEQLAAEVQKVLQSGAAGRLQLQLPNAHEWAEMWKESL
ncbi:MAG: glycosyltransferase family 4 protein [Patescibacteria group bacterium]